MSYTYDMGLADRWPYNEWDEDEYFRLQTARRERLKREQQERLNKAVEEQPVVDFDDIPF